VGNQVEEGFFSPFLQRARLAVTQPYLSRRVLDMGCGNGRLADYVSPGLYVGVERDQEAIAAARAAYPGHTFVERLPESGKFDTIVALALIEHLKRPQDALISWSKFLAEDGRIVLTTPHKAFRSVHDLGSRLGLFSQDAADEHETMFDRRSLDVLAGQSGLRVEHYKRFLGGANQLIVLAPSSADQLPSKTYEG
jgi:SAM-dependent methyltransferase